MKKLFLVFLLFLFPVMLFAQLYSYFIPMGTSYNVDLNSLDYSGTKNGKWGEYDDSDIAGLLGIANDSNPTIPDGTYYIEFTPSGDGWFYQSQNDPSLKIPYGLDLVIRYEFPSDKEGSTYDVVHLGNNENKGSDAPSSVVVTAAGGWEALWIDVVLTIPVQTRNEMAQNGKIQFGPADDYLTRFTIRVYGGKYNSETKEYEIDGTYTMYLSGFYGNYESGSGDILFVLEPAVNATYLELNTINVYKEGSQIEKSGTPLGTYYYSSTGIRSPEGNRFNFTDTSKFTSPFDMFISASRNPYIPYDRGFELRHVRYPDSTSESVNIPFVIGVKSKRSNDVEVYDGKGSADDTNTPKMTSIFRYDKSRPGDRDAVTFLDEGEIYFMLKEDLPQNIIAGYYTGNIYFHVICNG